MIRSLALASILALSTVVCAGAAEKPRQVAVSIAGINPADPAAATQLAQRIHDAAVAVCGPVQYPFGVHIADYVQANDDNARCIARAEAGARQHVAGLFSRQTRIAVASH